MASVTSERSLDVRANTLTPYLRVRIESRDRGAAVHWTESLLGLVPLRRRSITVATLDGARLRPRVFLDRLAIAIALLAVVGSGLVSSVWITAMIAVVAGALMFLSVVMVLHLPDERGGVHIIPVCVVRRRDIARFLEASP